MSERNRSAFTASQWEELQQQATIFKCMVSGVPIPPHLITTTKTSLESSLMPSRFFPHQPSFEMGFWRKAEEAEPGRCKRTDGKKWRCSKEAHPDSKYCERHMHRGKNHRSRKPPHVVEVTTTTTTTSTNSSQSTTNTSTNNTTHHLFLGSGTYSHQTEKDHHSYVHGERDEVEERAFFPEASGPLTMSSPPSGYSQIHFQSQSITGKSREEQRQQQEKHCFILGTDFKSAMPTKVQREEEKQRPFHHFLGEWPPKSREHSWLDIEQNRSNFMPPSTQDLFGSKSTFHTDG